MGKDLSGYRRRGDGAETLDIDDDGDWLGGRGGRDEAGVPRVVLLDSVGDVLSGAGLWCRRRSRIPPARAWACP